jgi:membrane protein insertase Oxa1/YidC/SpoIIIJ
LPGGSNLYILVSAAWRAGQQEIIFHKVITPHRAKEELKEKELSANQDIEVNDGKEVKKAELGSDSDGDNELEKIKQARIERKKRKKK